MPDSPELAAQKLLDSLPDGCELETSVEPVDGGWKATACLQHPTDSPRPIYVGKGATEDDALLAAIKVCANYWEGRHKQGASTISGWRVDQP